MSAFKKLGSSDKEFDALHSTILASTAIANGCNSSKCRFEQLLTHFHQVL
jgi:hypothetical protein